MVFYYSFRDLSILRNTACFRITSKYYWLWACLFAAFSLSAQGRIDDPYNSIGQGALGLKGGPTYHTISDLTRMMIPAGHDLMLYTATEQSRYGAMVDIFFTTRLPNAPVFFQPEISYMVGGSSLHYEDINEVTYDFTLDYQYVNIGFGFRCNPAMNVNRDEFPAISGLHVGLGAQYAINVKDYVRYVSPPDFTDDPRKREVLQETFRGKDNILVFGGIGYNYHWANFGIVLDVRHYLGLADIIETGALWSTNSPFSEQRNQTRTWAVTVGLTYALNPED